MDPTMIVPVGGAGALFVVMLRMLYTEIGTRRDIEEALRKEWAEERRQLRIDQAETLAQMRLNHSEDVAFLRERIASLEATVARQEAELAALRDKSA